MEKIRKIFERSNVRFKKTQFFENKNGYIVKIINEILFYGT